MHIELIDLLRCPQAHEDSQLVAALYRLDGRIVIEGKLGCPVCGAEYSIRNGVALFGAESESAAGTDTPPGGEMRPELASAHEPDGARVAAFLGLTRPGSVALLAGDWAGASDAAAKISGARIIALNGPPLDRGSKKIAEIRATPPIPLAERLLDGIALDEKHSTQLMLTEAARLLRSGGRLLAVSAVELPPQFAELARDASHVVAEYIGDLIPLRR